MRGTYIPPTTELHTLVKESRATPITDQSLIESWREGFEKGLSNAILVLSEEQSFDFKPAIAFLEAHLKSLKEANNASSSTVKNS